MRCHRDSPAVKPDAVPLCRLQVFSRGLLHKEKYRPLIDKQSPDMLQIGATTGYAPDVFRPMQLGLPKGSHHRRCNLSRMSVVAIFVVIAVPVNDAKWASLPEKLLRGRKDDHRLRQRCLIRLCSACT
jgi:hypothetical protein